MKQRKNKTVIIILEILAFILVAAGIFFGTYYLFVGKSSSSYEASVKEYMEKINTINNSMSSFTDGQTIDTEKKIPDKIIDVEKIRKELPDKTAELSKIRDTLQSIIPTDKYSKSQENLISGLDNNVLMYKQLYAIVQNPEGKDLDISRENLKKYKDECIKYYSLVNQKNAKISLHESSITLVNNTLLYVSEVIKLQKDLQVKQNISLEYINNMEAVTSKFAPIKVDFIAQLSKIRNEKGNLDDMIVLLNKNQDELNKVEEQFSNLTVPQNAMTCNKLFKTILDDYEDYIKSFNYALNNEKLVGTNITNEQITQFYSDATSKYNNVVKDYNNFLKAFTELKDLYLK